MLTKIKAHNPHFNTYSQDNAIIIQFIVIEFIASYKLAAQMQILVDECLKTEDVQESLLSSLFNAFQELLGTIGEHESTTFSSWNNGHLTKLRHFCCQFSKNIESQDKKYAALYNSVHQTWLIALNGIEIKNHLAHTRLPLTTMSLTILKRTLKLLFLRLNQVNKHIIQILSSFHDNENVMLFLFRKKELLSEVYGNNFLKKLFKPTDKKSLNKQDIIQLIMQRYIKRGFGHLISSINFS